jgi:hypothetical protein
VTAPRKGDLYRVAREPHYTGPTGLEPIDIVTIGDVVTIRSGPDLDGDVEISSPGMLVYFVRLSDLEPLPTQEPT